MTCDTLQAALTGAADGDTIILNSTAGPGGLCAKAYTFPNYPAPAGIEPYKSVTLKGDPASAGQDGFDGSGLSDRILTGVNIDRFEVQDLLFRDGTKTGDGGAIAVSGRSSLAVRTSTFLHNHATGKGGAIYFTQDFGANQAIRASLNLSDDVFGSLATPTEGNTADSDGGAVAVVAPGVQANSGINGSLFAHNTAGGNGGGLDWSLVDNAQDNVSFDNNHIEANKSNGSGGGAHVRVGNSTFLTFGSETYQGNSVEPVGAITPPSPNHFGGGLAVDNAGSSITHHDNLFSGNSIKAFTVGNYYGGAEAIAGSTPNVNSEADRFTGNSLPPPTNVDHESEGGGLYFAGLDSVFRGHTDLFAGNAVGGAGRGGGASAGKAAGGTGFEFSDTTVAGNAVGVGGSAAGLLGNTTDTLVLHNSIVSNSPVPDIAGFNNATVLFSDACKTAGTPFPGQGNICAAPLLADPANGDIHQTPASPTIDKGDDQTYFDDDGGEGRLSDFEGDPRPTDGDGDGHTVDMGADESPAFVKSVTPPGVTTSAAPAQCANGKDDDSDGAIDLQDPGCSSKADTNEGDETLNQLVLCGRRTISLVRADVKGSKVVLSGLVASRLAGRKVTILADHAGAKAARLSPLKSIKADGQGRFTATVPRPPAKEFSKARYQARVGTAKSVSLKLPQSLATATVKKVGSQIVVKGTVKRSLVGKRNAVVIRRIVCGHYKTVGSAKPARSGAYTVRFTAPTLSDAALFRAESRVLARPGAKKYVKQFARAVGIALTGQSG